MWGCLWGRKRAVGKELSSTSGSREGKGPSTTFSTLRSVFGLVHITIDYHGPDLKCPDGPPPPPCVESCIARARSLMPGNVPNANRVCTASACGLDIPFNCN